MPVMAEITTWGPLTSGHPFQRLGFNREQEVNCSSFTSGSSFSSLSLDWSICSPRSTEACFALMQTYHLTQAYLGQILVSGPSCNACPACSPALEEVQVSSAWLGPPSVNGAPVPAPGHQHPVLDLQPTTPRSAPNAPAALSRLSPRPYAKPPANS